MSRLLARFVLGLFLVWLISAIPLAGSLPEGSIGWSFVAWLLCIVPATGSLVLVLALSQRSPEERVLALFGGLMIRMGGVLIGGLFIQRQHPDLISHPLRLWGWVLFFYLVTLMGEVAVIARLADEPNPPSR